MRREQRAANVQKMKRATRNVEMQIDELILHGFRVADRYAIGDALSSELSQLVMNAEEYSFDRDLHVPIQRTGEILFPPGAKPVVLGTGIAQAVHAGLSTIDKGGRV